MMLALLDNSMLVSMPTKCGTERLKSTLVRKVQVACEMPEDHGLRRYAGFDNYLLLVRDPLERWVSTFWWLKSTEKNQGFQGIVEGVLDRFSDFAALVATRPSKAFVFKTLDEYVREFNPTRLCPLETLVDRWGEYFDPSWRDAYLSATPHKTRGKVPLEKTVKKLPAAFVRMLNAEYDALGGAYATRKPARG